MSETAVVETPKMERNREAEVQYVKGLFESTVTFFKLINKTMINLGYSRQKRRQVWESLVKHSTVNNDDIIKSLLDELKPIMDEAKTKTEQAST